MSTTNVQDAAQDMSQQAETTTAHETAAQSSQAPAATLHPAAPPSPTRRLT
ncbi:MAG: hypothetical protein ACFB01_11095 [Cohaesibacteraceae bacterium]